MDNTSTYTSIGQALGCKNYAVFINDNGQYCNISRYYIKNTLYFNVIFSKGLCDIATRNAIKTTSERKILKLLNSENFKLTTV